jgi:hypothetical protein
LSLPICKMDSFIMSWNFLACLCHIGLDFIVHCNWTYRFLPGPQLPSSSEEVGAQEGPQLQL